MERIGEGFMGRYSKHSFIRGRKNGITKFNKYNLQDKHSKANNIHYLFGNIHEINLTAAGTAAAAVHLVASARKGASLSALARLALGRGAALDFAARKHLATLN